MLRAILKRVIIEPPQPKSQTKGGIFLPDSNQEKYASRGKVISIGESVTCGVKLGDIVQFKKFQGNEVKDEGKTVLIVEEEDLIAIINE